MSFTARRQKNVSLPNWYFQVYLHLFRTHREKMSNISKVAQIWKSLLEIPYGKWVKHFCGITIYYITFCTTLYFTTYERIPLEETYPALFITIGSMEFGFFSNNACLEFLVMHIAVRQISHSTFSVPWIMPDYLTR